MTAPNEDSINRVDRNAEVYLDDADAVEKTTYVGDATGSDVGTRADGGARVTATVQRERGFGLLGWLVLALAVLAFAAYAAGLFS